MSTPDFAKLRERALAGLVMAFEHAAEKTEKSPDAMQFVPAFAAMHNAAVMELARQRVADMPCKCKADVAAAVELLSQIDVATTYQAEALAKALTILRKVAGKGGAV